MSRVEFTLNHIKNIPLWQSRRLSLSYEGIQLMGMVTNKKRLFIPTTTRMPENQWYNN